MGWAGGSYVMSGLIRALSSAGVDDEKRKLIYEDMIEVLENEDWDTQDESMGADEVFDEVIKKVHPDWDWDG